MRLRAIAGLALLYCLAGCGSVYHPKAAIPNTILSAPYVADLESPTLFAAYDALPDGPAKVARRNVILYELIHLTDVRYDSYEAGFFSGQAYVSTVADFAAMGLDAAGAITGTAATKAILAAVSGGVTGARSSYQKNFFDQATREAIVQQMRASRLMQLALIEAGMQNCSASTVCAATGTSYTLVQGFLDIEDYYKAGTVITALEAMSAASSQQAVAAREAIRAMRGIR